MQDLLWTLLLVNLSWACGFYARGVFDKLKRDWKRDEDLRRQQEVRPRA